MFFLLLTEVSPHDKLRITLSPIGCPEKVYIHGMEVPGNQYAVYRQCMQGYWLELLCKYNDTDSWWQGGVLEVCDFSGELPARPLVKMLVYLSLVA